MTENDTAVILQDGRRVTLDPEEWDAVVEAVRTDLASAHALDDEYLPLWRVVRKLGIHMAGVVDQPNA
jgi:hypothetical protein